MRLIYHYIKHIKYLLYQYWFNYINNKKFSLGNYSIGENVNFWGKLMVYIMPDSNVKFGNNIIITSGENKNALCPNSIGSFFLSEKSQLSIGDGCGMSSPHIWVKKKITIGRNVRIGADSIIIDNDCHNLDYIIRRDTTPASNGLPDDYNFCNASDVSIGDDVWIGARCIILKGVSIGPRSIIGAGSVVTHDIPSDCIAGGNPCKVLKKLYDGV